MRSNTLRIVATSATALLFLIVAVTGVLMFFHLFESQTKAMHEWLGMAMVAAVALHLFVHWKSMRSHVTKRGFALLGAAVSVSVILFLASAQSGPDMKRVAIGSLFEAPLMHAAPVLKTDVATALTQLKAAGLQTEGLDSIDALAKANGTSPFTVLAILTDQ
jgi:hypothetical protein